MKYPARLSCRQEIVDVIKEGILLMGLKVVVTYIPFRHESNHYK